MSNLLEEALDVIRARREAARVRGIELVGVVGSVARRQERPDSDVDVAYRIVGRPSLLDLGGIVMDLMDDLHREVGMIDLGCAPQDMRDRLERDLVAA